MALCIPCGFFIAPIHPQEFPSHGHASLTLDRIASAEVDYQCGLRHRPTLGQTHPPYYGLDFGITAGLTESSVTRRGQSAAAPQSGRMPSRHRRPAACRCSPHLARPAQSQHGRMQSIDARRQRRIGAVHAQGVLRQVVGADGEEIGFLRQLVGGTAAAGVSIITPSSTRSVMPISRANPD